MFKKLKYVFIVTLPVFFGYLVLGAAFGLLLQQAGYNFLWAIFISIVVFAGSMQFVLVTFLTNHTPLSMVAFMTLIVNSRHMFYGLSFIEKFKSMGNLRYYMIFSLTDETYSLLASAKAPEGMSEKQFFGMIAALNHSYWILGSALGAILGAIVPFSTKGVEFSMTALFVVIFLDQLKYSKTNLPIIIATVCSVVCIAVFGTGSFIFPALLLTVVILLLVKPKIEHIITSEELISK